MPHAVTQNDPTLMDAPQKDAAPGNQPSAVATAQDGSVFVAYFASGRIEKYSPDGSWITSWSATENSSPGSHPIAGFAVAGQFVFTMAASSPQIRVWALDGRHKLDADLGDHLSTITVAAPQIAVTPHSELLVFDPSVPRVYWFRMRLDAHVETQLETGGQK